jgi:hypothetical protein
MEFKNKHSHYFQMKDVGHLEADIALLKQHKPDAKSLRRLFDPDKAKLQQDVLWELLDVATVAEINANRGHVEVEVLKAKPGKIDRPGKPKKMAKSSQKNAPEPTPETISEDGEKKDTQADEGAGISADQLGESGEPGHTEGDHPIQ